MRFTVDPTLAMNKPETKFLKVRDREISLYESCFQPASSTGERTHFNMHFQIHCHVLTFLLFLLRPRALEVVPDCGIFSVRYCHDIIAVVPASSTIHSKTIDAPHNPSPSVRSNRRVNERMKILVRETFRVALASWNSYIRLLHDRRDRESLLHNAQYRI
jgi:hypothetical protein